ncbi:MAG: hypothetical protein MAG715_01073 [Methanonatronarchaeales archaeon]|nr:hypothetical protein [Methanonatronarchaeales archaeon]
MVKCPGSENSAIEFTGCPKCGSEVESFSTDPKAECGECGHVIFKDSNPTCVEWCESAVICVGEERYSEIMEALESSGPSEDGDGFVKRATDEPGELDLELA